MCFPPQNFKIFFLLSSFVNLLNFKDLGDKYFNGTDGFTKDLDKAVRWYRKAEKKIKDVKSIDFENAAQYQRQLELIRYKRDIAEEN